MSTTCGYCHSPAVAEIHRSRRTSRRVGRCRRCDLRQVLDPPAADHLAELYEDESYTTYLDSQRTDELRKRHAECLDHLHELLGPREEPPLLFDLGAGAGVFLEAAREHGFRVTGNEISAVAIREARERRGIEVSDRPLEEEAPASVDAVTMWCVLAHVDDPKALLDGIHRILRPGGVLYFHTPRWCAIDTSGLGLSRITRGRLSHVIDRRINDAHLRLYSEEALRGQVADSGFEVLELTARSSFSLETGSYLSSMSVPDRVGKPLSRALDTVIDRGWFPHNIFDVYARKPA